MRVAAGFFLFALSHFLAQSTERAGPAFGDPRLTSCAIDDHHFHPFIVDVVSSPNYWRLFGRDPVANPCLYLALHRTGEIATLFDC